MVCGTFICTFLGTVIFKLWVGSGLNGDPAESQPGGSQDEGGERQSVKGKAKVIL